MTTPNYRVLLIDDEETSYELTVERLRKAKDVTFSITWLNSFDGASEAVLSGEYDICLLDYYLGEESMSGLDFLQKMQASGCRIPFILLTAHGSHQIDVNALEAGAVEYLEKTTLKPETLARAIRYAVKQQRDKNELADLYTQLHELEQLKTDMIRIAAHDLRTPLMTMLNYARFLEDDQDNPLQDYQLGYVGEVINSVRQMQRIINDILSLERISETADESYQQEGDLAQLAHIACTERLPKDRDLTYTLHIPDKPMRFIGDPSQIREAISNFLTNAVKYTPDGGTVTVELTEEEAGYVLSVTDNGYGIPDEMQDRLFQPFYRAKSRKTRHIAGTGLGLHLVKNIVERHDGRVFFHSVYGEGSTFGFSLPAKDEKTEK